MKHPMTMAAAAVVLSTTAAGAAGIFPLGTVSASFDSDIEAETLRGTGVSIDGGACDSFDLSGCDVLVTSDGFNYGFDASDETTFRIALQDDNFSVGPSDLTVEALFSTTPGHEISSITASPDSEFLAFLFDPIANPTSPIEDPTLPEISFESADGAIAGEARVGLIFSGIDPDWWADGGYFLDFDVTFAPTGEGSPEVIPLPAAAWLLGAGLLGLGGLRRRRR